MALPCGAQPRDGSVSRGSENSAFRYRRCGSLGDGRSTRSSSPEEDAIQNEEIRRVRAALGRLTQQQRAAVMLRAEELRFREIASVLGVSTKRVLRTDPAGFASVGGGTMSFLLRKLNRLQHLSDETLSRLLSGELSTFRSIRARAHIAKCWGCRSPPRCAGSNSLCRLRSIGRAWPILFLRMCDDGKGCLPT